MKLAGKVAIVSGGAQGIGKEICKALLTRGANVCILDINKDQGQSQTETFQQEFGQKKVLFVPCDVSNKDQFAAAFEKTNSEYGKVDIVCNNAGILGMGDLDRYEQIIDINLKGVVLGTKLGLQYMKQSGGAIVNVASMAGLLPAPGQSVYTATKHAVVGFTRSLAMTSIAQGIRINCICPSFTDTNMVRKGIEAQPDSPLTQIIGKLGLLSPDLIATGVMELIEDDTKNGEVMRVTTKNGIDYQPYPKQPKL